MAFGGSFVRRRTLDLFDSVTGLRYNEINIFESIFLNMQKIYGG